MTVMTFFSTKREISVKLWPQIQNCFQVCYNFLASRLYGEVKQTNYKIRRGKVKLTF